MTDWRQRRWINLILLGLIAGVVACLVLLGNWQMRRLEWKTDLIAAVESRSGAQPVAAPGRRVWDEVTAETHAYLRVEAEGILLREYEIFVQALTELGAGYWVMTPLQLSEDEIIWINLGFVPANRRDRDTRNSNLSDDNFRITGFLRITEPEGTLLQENDPIHDRWYSRDVSAFSHHVGLIRPAPYFIDADHLGAAESWPRGGMTRVTFRNNHLQYALTWYTMALLLIAGTGYVVWLLRHPEKSESA